MKLDRNGAALCASFEAIYLFTYPDPATKKEPWTAGIGHTAAAGGIAPRPGQLFTLAQVLDIFRDDMERVETRVNRAIHAPLGQPQFNVLCSFDLNTGAIASGSVDDKINAGSPNAALATLVQYNKAAGHFMQGLANRRAIEAKIYRSGVYPALKIAYYDRPGAQVRYLLPDALPWDAQEPKGIDGITAIALPSTPTKRPKDNFLIDLAKAIWRLFA